MLFIPFLVRRTSRVSEMMEGRIMVVQHVISRAVDTSLDPDLGELFDDKELFGGGFVCQKSGSHDTSWKASHHESSVSNRPSYFECAVFDPVHGGIGKG